MPEGDTIYRTAAVLRCVLQGKQLARLDTTVPQVAAASARHAVVGRVIHEVTPRAKHLLLNRRPGFRRTRATLDPEGRIWVYRRSGRACYRCGATIQVRRQGVDARSTYFCLTCQNVSIRA